MKEFTVKDLQKVVEEEVKNGNGDKVIHLSSDNEGNGFHQMFFAFTPVTELYEQHYGLNSGTDIILG